MIADTKARVTALDALRGLAMVIMALDHVRDFLHVDAFTFRPDDLTRTTVMLFLTRWITHICAPLFMFAAGASAFLWRRNGRTAADLSGYLWKRGLWLVLLELTLLRMALNFNPLTGPILLTVLWALGWSMVALAALSRLPVRVLATLSIVVIALHNLMDTVRASPAPTASLASVVWKVLHQQGVVALGSVIIIVAYPLIPWIAVMAAGFCFVYVLVMPAERRQKWILRLGLGLTAAFLAVRALNVYGDPQPWSVQASPAFTVLSFLRCTKYPPSLEFLLMTLGPGLLLLAWFYRIEPKLSNPLVAIGRVPLFYFLGHMFMAHLLAIPFALVKYGRAGFLLNPPPAAGGPAGAYPEPYGYSLGVVYLAWAIVVALMYPLCVWFGKWKARNKSNWLSYL